MGRKIYLLLSGLIFAVVSMSHLLRAFYRVELNAGGWEFPLGLSWAGGFVTLVLCVWAFTLAAREKDRS